MQRIHRGLLAVCAGTAGAAISIMVIAVAARVVIPVAILTPLLIASVPPLVVRGVAALALRAKCHPRMIRLRAAVAVFAHFLGELGFRFLSAPLALFHAFVVPISILMLVVPVLGVRKLRNGCSDE